MEIERRLRPHKVVLYAKLMWCENEQSEPNVPFVKDLFDVCARIVVAYFHTILCNVKSLNYHAFSCWQCVIASNHTHASTRIGFCWAANEWRLEWTRTNCSRTCAEKNYTLQLLSDNEGCFYKLTLDVDFTKTSPAKTSFQPLHCKILTGTAMAHSLHSFFFYTDFLMSGRGGWFLTENKGDTWLASLVLLEKVNVFRSSLISKLLCSARFLLTST